MLSHKRFLPTVQVPVVQPQAKPRCLAGVEVPTRTTPPRTHLPLLLGAMSRRQRPLPMVQGPVVRPLPLGRELAGVMGTVEVGVVRPQHRAPLLLQRPLLPPHSLLLPERNQLLPERSALLGMRSQRATHSVQVPPLHRRKHVPFLRTGTKPVGASLKASRRKLIPIGPGRRFAASWTHPMLLVAILWALPPLLGCSARVGI